MVAFLFISELCKPEKIISSITQEVSYQSFSKIAIGAQDQRHCLYSAAFYYYVWQSLR